MGIVYFNFASANPIAVDSNDHMIKPNLLDTIINGLPGLIILLITALVIEIFFGWLIFFRNNKKGLLGTLVGNLISVPLLYLAMSIYNHYFISYVGFINFTDIITPVIIFELIVVIFEMFVYKFILKENITYKKAFINSLILNILSLSLPFVFIGIVNVFFYNV